MESPFFQTFGLKTKSKKQEMGIGQIQAPATLTD